MWWTDSQLRRFASHARMFPLSCLGHTINVQRRQLYFHYKVNYASKNLKWSATMDQSLSIFNANASLLFLAKKCDTRRDKANGWMGPEDEEVLLRFQTAFQYQCSDWQVTAAGGLITVKQEKRLLINLFRSLQATSSKRMNCVRHWKRRSTMIIVEIRIDDVWCL